MHSQRYADNLRRRYDMITLKAFPDCDYWMDKALEAFAQLTNILGEVETDEWFDTYIPDHSTWMAIYNRLAEYLKMIESVPLPEETAMQHKLDVCQQAHPGIV